MNNSVGVLFPYLTKNKQLVFDDDRFDLIQEPFVFGADTLLIEIAQKNNIKDLSVGFSLIFSKQPLPQFDLILQLIKPDGNNGHFYAPVNELERLVWLCPAMLHYFSEAPKNIYFKITEK